MLSVESLEENFELAPKDWSNFKIPTGVLLSYWPKGTLKIVLLTRILRSQDKVLCMNSYNRPTVFIRTLQ